MTTGEQSTERTLGRLEANVENVQTGVTEVKSEQQRTNVRIDRLDAKVDRLFYAIIGVGGGIIVALIALIIRGF